MDNVNGKTKVLSDLIELKTSGQKLEICNALASADLAGQQVGTLLRMARSQIYGNLDAEALDRLHSAAKVFGDALAAIDELIFKV
jgi:hypothetical protein